MSEWEEEESGFAEDEGECEYGCGFCSDPSTRENGLCTTECQTYMDAAKEDAEH